MKEIEQVTVFTPGNNCPSEVYEEIRELWVDYELSNGAYMNWYDDEDDHNDDRLGIKYPHIKKYLDYRNIKKCLINWCW